MFKSDEARQFIDPVSDKLLTCLLKLCAQSKRVVVQLGSACVLDLLNICSYNVRLLERLCNSMLEKSVGLREKSAELILFQLQQSVGTATGKQTFFKSGALDMLDRMLVKALGDASAIVRSQSRQVLALYQQEWPDRAQLLIDGLDTSTKKILARSSNVVAAAVVPGLKKKPASSSLSSLKAKKAVALASSKHEDISVTIFAPPPHTVKAAPRAAVETTPAKSSSEKHFNSPPRQPTSEYQTPAKEIVLKNTTLPVEAAQKNRNFGMVGIPSSQRHTNISLTPLMQQQHRKLSQMSLEDSPMPQSKNPNQPLVSSSLVPTSFTDRQKMLKLSSSMRESALNEKHFRRICRFSKLYGQPSADSSQEEVELCRLWQSEFPAILQTLINIITSLIHDTLQQPQQSLTPKDGPYIHIENSLISLKYALQYHPPLFGGYEQQTVHSLMLVLAATEDSIYSGTASELSTVAMDVFGECMREMPFEVVSQVIVDELKEHQEKDMSSKLTKTSAFEHSMKGVCFRLLGTLASTYVSVSGSLDDMHPVEQHLVIPVFEAGLVHDNITCSRVMTRMAVYEYLISVWKVLGNIFVKQYLVPIAAQANMATVQRSCLMKGLSLPCYKLFLALCDQDKQKVMTTV